MAIFSNMVEKIIEVFMDDFSGFSFESCLSNLEMVLKQYKETNLVRYWEKYHLMVQKWILLGHRIPADGIKVDKVKIQMIEKLSRQHQLRECIVF